MLLNNLGCSPGDRRPAVIVAHYCSGLEHSFELFRPRIRMSNYADRLSRQIELNWPVQLLRITL
jgi:hypothetical protein